MLELVSGRLPIENYKEYIVREFKVTMNETGYIYNLVDPVIRCGNLIGMEEFVELALKCVEDSGDKRPSMGKVVKEIESIIQAGEKNLKAVLSSYAGTSDTGSELVTATVTSLKAERVVLFQDERAWLNVMFKDFSSLLLLSFLFCIGMRYLVL